MIAWLHDKGVPLLFALAALLFIVLIVGKARGQEDFDNWLVLAVDTSASVSDEEYSIQKKGYVEVLMDPMVGKALDRTAIAIVEFSSLATTVVDWTDAFGAGAAYQNLERSGRDSTCVACAIERALNMLAGKQGKRVLDISGDGCDNVAWTDAVIKLQKLSIDQDVQINTLAILVEPDNSGCQGVSKEPRWEGDTKLARWYEMLATGFSMSIGHLDDLQQALRRKLFAEIALESP